MKTAQKQAVAYARVSSKAQEETGFSIDAQKTLLIDYAAKNGITIVEWFIEARSAKVGSDRREFRRLSEYLARHTEVRIVLCEKTDRFSRNFADAEMAETLQIELHCIRDNLVVAPNSSPTQHLQHELQLVLAKNYLRNLRREIVKGMTTKARSGLWPSCAPIGYQNQAGKEQSIVPDPEMAPKVRQLFELAATGRYSGQELTRRARAIGLRTRRGGGISKNWVLRLLRNEIYIGVVVWAGERSDGRHAPIVTRALFDQVQRALGQPKTKGRHAFTFNGFLRCAGCQGLLSSDVKVKRRVLPSGEVLERRYTYLHCNGRGGCGRKHYREEVFTDAIGALLTSMQIDGPLSAWLEAQLGVWHDEQRANSTAILEHITQERQRVDRLREAAYIDKISGTVDATLWETLDTKWRGELDQLAMESKQVATLPPKPAFLAAARRPIELLQRAPLLWVRRSPAEKAALAKMMLIELTVDNGSCSPVYRSPFDVLANGIQTGNWWS